MSTEKRIRAKTTNGPKVVSELKKLGYEAEFRCDMQPLWGYVVTHAPHRVVDAAFKAALDPSRVITSDEVEVAKQVATKAAEAAYRGECHGVNPDELLAYRVASRARYQHRGDSERGAAKGDVAHYESLIRERIEAARAALATARKEALGCVCEGCDAVDARDMRRDSPIDELLEAATRDGVAYIAGPFLQPDARRKFTCSGSRAHIEAFMAHWAPANGLVDIYGDPARGFAGGYEA